MHNFVCPNVRILPLHLLLTRGIKTFWSKGIDKFCSGGTKTFWAQNIIAEKSTKLTKISELYHDFIWPKMFLYFHIYCRHVLKAFLPFLPTFSTILSQLCQLFTTSQLYTNFYQ